MKALTDRMTAAFLLIVLLSQACRQAAKGPSSIDTPASGQIHISVDESYKPVIEEQLSMYQSGNPAAHIIAEYKPEAACLKDFFKDTGNRMILITRGLTYPEENYMKDSLGYLPQWNLLASDAIAIIVNKNNKDTLFTLDRLAQQLAGKINRHQTIVFDGLSATSSFRFVQDSILKGLSPDTTVVRAAKNSLGVIDYVATHEQAIGLVGISWIGNPEDTLQQRLREMVRISYVRCDACADSPYVKPVQESIRSRRYPLVRGLYYIIKENYYGLGSGLVDFMKYERGQLIFRRAYLGPVMDFDSRNVRINLSLPKK